MAEPRRRAPRSDAQSNRAAIVAAARAAFAQRGVKATIADVARAAGVGRATVHRNFPTREALGVAVVVDQVDRATDRVVAASESADPWHGFEELLMAMGAELAATAVMPEVIRSLSAHPDVRPRLERYHAALSTLLEQAKATGAMRSDLTRDQLLVLIVGTARVLGERAESDPAVWRANMELIVAAARAR
jgi:AcrR family transcriptional regulator